MSVTALKVLVIGKSGQLARELVRTCPDNIELVCLGRDQLDLSMAGANPYLIEQAIADLAPDVVINAAAYTAVDAAESNKDSAFLINHTAVACIAAACKKIDTKLLHISTDFIFDGQKTTPYKALDAAKPLNIYGQSKLAGEAAVREQLGANGVIIRTAWVYSVYGNNFVKSMLRLMGERDSLGIVADQVGTPTWAKGLAHMLWVLAQQIDLQPADYSADSTILHWTDAGTASWYDFAVAVYELATDKGMLNREVSVKPIPASAYPTPAVRPNYSLLDKQETEQYLQYDTQHWRQQLSVMLDELTTRENE